jgi:prepilin-type N-terminal cleavage/methylation domain-containing protein/prepilin-type processing-associated H-X9-DG protein
MRPHATPKTPLGTKPGFSLTEVLVVLLIIAVLAAILFPVAASLRERAGAAQCVQNLRQIGVGLHAHISENGGRLPNGRAHVSWLKDDQNNSLGLSWYDAAAWNMGREQYSRKFKDPAAEPLPQVFGCPSGHGRAHHPEWPYTGDYAANLYLGQQTHNAVNLSSIRQPASTPYVQDTVKQNNFGAWIFAAGFSPSTDSAFAARHRGKGNILWVDGHVSSLGYGEYMKMANDPKYGSVMNFLRGSW